MRRDVSFRVRVSVIVESSSSVVGLQLFGIEVSLPSELRSLALMRDNCMGRMLISVVLEGT
jgi:hypothetical protein